MILHLDKNLFRDAIRITAQQMNIQPEFVEKDYWGLMLYTSFLIMKLETIQYLREEQRFPNAIK